MSLTKQEQTLKGLVTAQKFLKDTGRGDKPLCKQIEEQTKVVKGGNGKG